MSTTDDVLDRRVVAARDHLRAVIDPSPPDLVSFASAARTRRRVVTAAGAAATAIAVILLATGLAITARQSDDTSGVIAGPAPAPAPTAGSGLQSATVAVRGMPTVLATYTDRIDVFEWNGSAWRVAASVDAPGVLEEQDPHQPLVVSDVTGDGQPDFVVPLAATSTSPYEVISDDGGSGWRPVPFGSSDRVVVTQPDAPSADRFVTSTNTCAPDCAQGRYLRELWRYSGTQKQFTVAERAMCQAIDPTHWQCDPANPTLARGEPIGPPR